MASPRLGLSTRQIGFVALMTAASVSTNYLLIGVVNVKLMDLFVFVSGLLYGPLVGASVGILTWLVYGTLNPYGFSLPILAVTMVGEALYGVAGGLLGRRVLEGEGLIDGVKFGVLGFLLTALYDLLTNVASGLVVGIPIATALVAGVPFALIHEVSNALFFSVGVTPLLRALSRLGGGLVEG